MLETLSTCALFGTSDPFEGPPLLVFECELGPPPMTHQQGYKARIQRAKGGGKQFIRFYTSREYETMEQGYLKALMAHRPARPLEGPLAIYWRMAWPWRQSELKRVTGEFSAVPKDTKPDMGNSLKGPEDMLTKLGFWRDDSQVSTVIGRKVWSDTPSIEVRIYQDLPTPREIS